MTLAGFSIWSITPYIYFWFSANNKSSSPVVAWVGLSVAFLICAGGVGVYYDSLFIHPDAQGGLVLLLLPIYQWIVIGVYSLIVYVYQRIMETGI